ncbi:hypothetical protein GGI35DRAFT_477630 [Trichoderma velutinum]
MANSAILGPSPKFGQIDSLIFSDREAKTDDKTDTLYSDDSEDPEMIPDLYMGGYLPIPNSNKIVVYEVAYTEQQQFIWSFVCGESDVTDAQAEALSRAKQTPEAMELKRKWGIIWEDVLNKKPLSLEGNIQWIVMIKRYLNAVTFRGRSQLPS